MIRFREICESAKFFWELLYKILKIHLFSTNKKYNYNVKRVIRVKYLKSEASAIFAPGDYQKNVPVLSSSNCMHRPGGVWFGSIVSHTNIDFGINFYKISPEMRISHMWKNSIKPFFSFFSLGYLKNYIFFFFSFNSILKKESHTLGRCHRDVLTQNF